MLTATTGLAPVERCSTTQSRRPEKCSWIGIIAHEKHAPFDDFLTAEK